MIEKPEGYVFGRPRVYDSAFCDRVIQAGKLGKSITWMAADLHISKDTLYRWEREYEDFSYALALARIYSQQWWEDLGQKHAVNEPNGPTINASLYSRSMAARFPDDWRENTKIEHTGKNGGAIETVNRVELVPMNNGNSQD